MTTIIRLAALATVAWLCAHPAWSLVAAGLCVWACVSQGAAALYWERGRREYAWVAMTSIVAGCAMVSTGLVLV